MGLSGRKIKQRIPNDPRNLAWANDATKFGAAYLSKFGWDPSSGLGASGDGRTKALSVHQKLDMLGIGADHKFSAEGLAWKQNKDFESLLRRLNSANGSGESEEVPMKIDGFTKGASMTTIEAENSTISSMDSQAEGSAGPKKSKKKRKKDADREENEDRQKEFKKRKSSGDTSEVKRISKKEKKEVKRDEEASSNALIPPVPAGSTMHYRHPRAAFRARHMAAKSRATTSSTALAEILGIADSSSLTPTPLLSTSSEPSTGLIESSGALTSAAADLKSQELTVSSKSVTDYFKEKLATKSRPSSSAGAPAPEETEDYGNQPRMGLGACGMRTKGAQGADIVERSGLGGLGSRSRAAFASMFALAAATPSADTAVQSNHDVPSKKSKEKEKKRKRKDKTVEDVEEIGDAEVTDEKEERKRRKEDKRRRKEARSAAAGSDRVAGAQTVEGGRAKRLASS